MHTRVALFTFVLLAAGGCTRRSLGYGDGGSDPCSALGTGNCSSNSDCELISPCTCRDPGPPVCVTRGTVFHCPACAGCSTLGEAACTANASCRADYCTECGCAPVFTACVDVGAPATTCPAVACVQPFCGCDGLDEKSCGANPSCTPNYCVGCGGAQVYAGCTGPGEQPPTCSPAGCDCHTQSDCGPGDVCLAPGASPGCGVCTRKTPAGCTSDSQCTGGLVCDVVACSCNGEKACVAGCTSSSCAEGQTCGSDGHCAATSCTSTAQCPAWFDCVFVTGQGSRCERRACTSDGECGSGGFCVDGGCYGSPGSCQPPPV